MCTVLPKTNPEMPQTSLRNEAAAKVKVKSEMAWQQGGARTVALAGITPGKGGRGRGFVPGATKSQPVLEQ